MKDVMISPIPRCAGMMVVIVVMRIPVLIIVLNVNVFWLTQVFIFLSFSISYQSFNDSNFLGNSLDILKDYIDLESKCPFGYLGLIGDGFCQTEFNIAECDFDGGDCNNGKQIRNFSNVIPLKPNYCC
jgi:hypothetical protein